MENCANSSTSSYNKKLYLPDLIPIRALLGYHSIGFKVVPCGADSKTSAIKSTTEIFDDHEYWSTDLLKVAHYRFKIVVTTFGKTSIKDEKGEYLYLQGLDVDSDSS
jgi:hypothetical protein